MIQVATQRCLRSLANTPLNHHALHMYVCRNQDMTLRVYVKLTHIGFQYMRLEEHNTYEGITCIPFLSTYLQGHRKQILAKSWAVKYP
jgi:hypothetical protein